MKDKISMPLIEAMLQYKSEDVYPLHTPGHKGGRGMQRLLRAAPRGGFTPAPWWPACRWTCR